jgi:signal transduction histidine kinase
VAALVSVDETSNAHWNGRMTDDREALLEAAARRSAFLAAASSALAESLDYRITLRRVAELAVPAIADWCTVTVVDEVGALRRVAVVHSDPAREALTREYEAKFPPGAHRGGAFADVARTRKPVLMNDLGEQVISDAAQNEDHLRVLRGLGVRSCIMVPLASSRDFIGVISFMISDSPRRYGPDDLHLAQDLAARAGLAVENARLYEEQRKAVELRDTFLSVASHELRAPLGALSLRVDLMERIVADEKAADEKLGAKLEPQLGAMRRQIHRLDALLHALLDVSRITSGRLHLDLGDACAASIVRDAVTRFTANVSLDAPDALPMHTDAMRIEQVAVNLIDNAVKYGAGKPVEVRLAQEGDATSSWMVLEVTDHGIGIAKENQARIFERFERAVPPRSYKGLGLGLYIVRNICEALGGEVSVESEPGRTTFRVRLPLTAKRDGTPETQPPS